MYQPYHFATNQQALNPDKGAPDGLHDVHVERVALRKRLVQRDLANVGTHRRLRQLRDREQWVLHPIGRLPRIHDLRGCQQDFAR